ncbi:MAG: EAL domain-containing protein [Myxococcota bacterium]
MSRRKRTQWTYSEGFRIDELLESTRTLAPEELYVVYQPIVDVRTKKVFAHEALARCTRPGFEDPTALFARSCTDKFVGRLGRMVRDIALIDDSRERLFLNLHPEELSARWLVRPDDPLNTYRGPLFLEITEAAALDYFEICRDVLREICNRTGATIVVDDLGAGYSNLLRIVDLEPGVVKLDKDLLHGLDRAPRQQILVKNIVNMCAELGALVVGEGVETKDELSAAIDCGVTLIQGYVLARPSKELGGFQWPSDLG